MGMHRGNLFIARENMTSAYDLESVSNLSDIAYYHFMNYEDEVLYLLYEGKLLGVLSIGDLERFFDSSEKELKINQKYASISAVNYDAAERFFGNSITINEIPIVTECGFFVGIIRKEKTKALRDQQRRELEAAKKGEGMWRRGEMWRFVNETKASVFLYTYSDKKVMKQLEYEDKQKIKKHRRKMEEESIWEVLTKQEWDTFLHGEKDEGVDTLRKERDSCIPAFINGKAIFPDVSGNYYTIQRGHRFTPNNPLYADRKIIMFGPCNVFGAFCKDDQTIEAYLQDSLNANGYISWRVLNKGVCGVDICYPRQNIEEYMLIQESGGIISEYPPGMPPVAGNFPMRNRIISALSDGILIIEAGEKSGSLITAEFGIEQGKDIFVVPGDIGNKLYYGSNKLIKNGAALVTNIEDIMDALGIFYDCNIESQKKKIEVVLETSEKIVYASLSLEPAHVSEIASRTGFGIQRTMEILIGLELKHFVCMAGNNYFAIKI